jgi:hypothetical protein
LSYPFPQTTPKNSFGFLPPRDLPEREQGRIGGGGEVLKTHWSYYIAVSAPHAENTHFSSQVGIRAGYRNEKKHILRILTRQ